MVWVETLPERRIIILKLQSRDPKDPDFGFSSPARLPEALVVCQESRVEALRHYSKAFGNVYINFEQDVLFLQDDIMLWPPVFFNGEFQSLFKSLCSTYAQDLAKVKKLTLDWETCWNYQKRRKPEPIRSHFPALKQASWLSNAKHFSDPQYVDSVLEIDDRYKLTASSLQRNQHEGWEKALGLSLVKGRLELHVRKQ
jgi:hypothetical protein